MLRRLSEQDHYQVLEVSYDASSEEIQSAFETARDIYSHEALVSSSILSDRERRRTFHRISEAYQTLIAEESRRLYDKRLGVPEPVVRREQGSRFATADNVEATSTNGDVAPSEAHAEREHVSADDVETPEKAAGSETGCYVSTIGKPHEYFDLTRTTWPVDLFSVWSILDSSVARARRVCFEHTCSRLGKVSRGRCHRQNTNNPERTSIWRVLSS